MKNFNLTGIWALRRYLAIILLAVCLSVFTQVLKGSEPGNSFSFVFMTDIHLKPELKGDDGFRAAIARVNELKPDFVITGGDLIMDALEQNGDKFMVYDILELVQEAI